MRYALISDIHSNLQALEAVVGACRNKAIDHFLCLGDIVGYGANPNECLDLVQKLKTITVAGNHDWGLVGKKSIEYFNSIAVGALCWSRRVLSESKQDVLAELPLIHKGRDFILVHGTYHHPEHFEYMIDPSAAKQSFQILDKTLCFVGHSHIPGVFRYKDENISYTSEVYFSVDENARYIINVGSVGQPRDRDPRSSFCIYDSDQKTVRGERVHYNIEGAQKAIIGAGLSGFLASRLKVGQ